MSFTGDPAGIAALKAMREDNLEGLKMLLDEVKTNSDRKATFSAQDGTVYVLEHDLVAGTMRVTAKSAGGSA